MAFLHPASQAVDTLLAHARVIAVVGHSDNPMRTSYQIAQFLRGAGYTVYAVNPHVQTIDGERCYPSLADVPESIDIVNVFRRSEHLLEVVQAAVGVQAKSVWAQLGVYDEDAIAYAEQAGIDMIADYCIKVAYQQMQARRA